MNACPSSAKVIIIGGGIVGCATAYHLARLGCDEVLLLERHKLTSGSTFHAAGLVGQLRSNANITQLLGDSVALYGSLEEETGLASGWKQNGGLRLACNEERWTELKRQATTARSFGLDMELLGPQEAKALWPLMDVQDVIGAAYLPTDGQANPSDITQSLARGARRHGVQILENVTVTGIGVHSGRVTSVMTEFGEIQCEKVVNCAGQWAREIGEMAGVNVPLVSIQHQYIVTEPIEGVTSGLPTLRDPDRLTYYKEEVGGLVMGGYEQNPKAWASYGIPEGFNFQLLESDWDHFEQFVNLAVGRVPALRDAGIRTLVNGPESFTPDGNFILGEAPEVNNFFIGAGFNAFGIAAGGGAGMALAEWVYRGNPPFDLWPVDIRRFGQPHRDVEWVRTRTLELYGKHYTISWPQEEHASGRPCRRSPLYDRLKAQGACFGEKLGWERPNWFAGSVEEAQDQHTFGHPNWFEVVANEHRATREQVAVFDQSSFAKFMVIGSGAEAALSWVCANDISKPPGSVIYTQMLNEQGGIECDLTVTRLSDDCFYIITGTGFATHDSAWIKNNIRAYDNVYLIDVTSSRAVLSVMGPHARDVLSKLTQVDLSNRGCPFGRAREIFVAGTPVLALRLTFVGELGWELHMPVEGAVGVYEAIMRAGEEFGVVNAGYRAIESLRLEKGYRVWSSDIGPDYTPLEAGLGFALKLSSDIDFLGKKSLLKQKAQGLSKRLACFTVADNDVILLGRETILRNGERVGWISSGGFGHTIGRPIGYGYVRNSDIVDKEFLMSGKYELVVANETVPCTIHLGPLYDAKMDRVKA